MERINVGAPFVGIRRRADTTVPERRNNGITLIALIITIIVMLILAGIVLAMTIGENGIIKRTQQAGIKTEEAQAREKLELVLFDLQADKVTNTNYNENEYIDSYLSKKGMIVAGNTVTVDGWKFEIDRSIPKVGIGLGKGEESKKITIVSNVENASDYTKATIKVEITYENEITKIQINGEEVEVPQKTDGKYTVEKEVTNNGNYTIYVQGENGEYKTNATNVNEISEDMEIDSAQKLVAFRDRVNKGATYEGRTVQLTANIDLSSVCYKVDGTPENDVSWEPIGTTTYETKDEDMSFRGTFNGNYHKIQNLYINTDKTTSQGLFGYVKNGKVENLIIDETCSINAMNSYCCGEIAGWITTSTIENCANYGTVKANACVAGIVGIAYEHSKVLASFNAGNVEGSGNTIGGIVGDLWNETKKDETEECIVYCYNTGSVTSTAGIVGGICGYQEGGCSSISKCYNTGDVTGGKSRTGGIVGLNRVKISNTITKVEYCCNKGNVLGSENYVGGICGRNFDTNSYVKNCYNDSQATVKLNNISATKNIGTASNYVGKIVGKNEGTVSDIGELSQTVYYVVNGNSNEDSQYWSKDNVNEPKLKWEVNIK